ncbi:u1 small nuclear ribonucleoprotein c, partial [Quercus suber]
PSVRKQHNAGYKHKANVRSYYQQFEEAQTQNFIDQRIKEHLGQTAAFQQVGAAYNQHLMVQRPRLPVLPTPVMLMPGSTQLPGSSPLIPGIRPPVLQRPLGAPVRKSLNWDAIALSHEQTFLNWLGLGATIPALIQPGSVGHVRFPTFCCCYMPSPAMAPMMAPPATTVPGSTAAPTSSNSAPPMVTPSLYQANPVSSTGGGYDSLNANTQAPETNH